MASRTLIIEIAGEVTVIAFNMTHLDQDMNDSLLQEESQSTNAEPHPNLNKESKKLTEKDGEIGYIKNGVFHPMTNFSVDCVGYVVDRIGSTSGNGFLFRVIPKDCVNTDTEDADSDTWYDLQLIVKLCC